MDNIKEFSNGTFIQSIYTKIVYKVIEHDKRGMAVLLNLRTDKKEDWNAENNNHFIKVEGQLNLF